MTAREWQPSDVAMVDDPAHGERVMVRRDTSNFGSCWHALDDDRCLDAKQAGDARPLVVIDPEDDEQVERLAKQIRHLWQSHAYVVDVVQAALREFANPTPPKPEEPIGLGAVVEDAEGVQWVRVNRHRDSYRQSNGDRPGRYLRWADIDAVRVLSEGIQ